MQITSDYGEPFINGNHNLYIGDPFELWQNNSQESGSRSLEDIISNTFSNYGDHAEIFGFNLLNFKAISEKLDPLNGDGVFKGFSPRWMLPTRLRNSHNPALNTSCILIIIDSAREVDLDLVPFFGKEILGDSEILISNNTAKHLNVAHNRK